MGQGGEERWGLEVVSILLQRDAYYSVHYPRLRLAGSSEFIVPNLVCGLRNIPP
jgi:hypothetical protein